MPKKKIEWLVVLCFLAAIVIAIIFTYVFVRIPLVDADGEVAIATSSHEGMAGATVTNVHDGDTITVKWGSDQKEYKIRLAGIDAPEIKQACGTLAAGYLEQILDGKTIEVFWKEKDRYGRIVGVVYLPGLAYNHNKVSSINAHMLAAGYAWHYKQYDKDPVFTYLENQARVARTGLWGEAANPEAPWDFRRRTK